jgi:hypothetical protein
MIRTATGTLGAGKRVRLLGLEHVLADGASSPEGLNPEEVSCELP